MARNTVARYLVSAMPSPSKPPLKKNQKPKDGPPSEPAQRALLNQIPAICAVFEVDPKTFTVRPVAKTPRDEVHNALRPYALGAIAHLGIYLGLSLNSLHGRYDYGHTQIRELRGAHRYSMVKFAARFDALAGYAVNRKGEPQAPVGEVGRFVRQRFDMIRADALRERDSLPLPDVTGGAT